MKTEKKKKKQKKKWFGYDGFYCPFCGARDSFAALSADLKV